MSSVQAIVISVQCHNRTESQRTEFTQLVSDQTLRQAHDRNDETIERIYIGRRFKNDTERLEKLFEMYTKMTTKLKASARV